MNAQSNVQDLKNSRYLLYKVEEERAQFDASVHHQISVFGEMPQPAGEVKNFPVPGQHISFVARIRELLESNMDDETYGIDQLCRDAGASRSQIHNKLKKWTGLSTAFFIRSIKLERAKYLLVQTDLNISQVAYEVGFQDPSYFTRVFDESFGICPKNFRKRWQQARPTHFKMQL